MPDRKGDNAKRIEGCNDNKVGDKKCPNLQSRETYDTETRWCDICGEYYRLYDDEMK